MITVELIIPILNETIDFRLDENTKAGVLTMQMEQLILQKKHMTSDGQPKYLYAFETEKILEPEKTLQQQEIQNGEQLILL